MRRIFVWSAFLVLLASLMASAPAQAQATRTYVSGVGDDANPCSRTAPCKTFAGAIVQTAAGGEINCLDPGGFGTVTITKAITIDCRGTMGSILASATNGINVNAGANDKIVVRNLSINGAGTTLGLKGINILAAKSVLIENVMIFDFSQQAIVDTRSTGGLLTVIDTVAHDVGGAGIATATSGGTLKLLIDNFRSVGNGFGVALSTNTNAMIRNSEFAGNTSAGIDNEGALIIANGDSITGNGTGVLNSAGTTRLSNTDLALNTTAINNTSGFVVTYGNNRNPGPNMGTITPAGSATSDLGQQ